MVMSSFLMTYILQTNVISLLEEMRRGLIASKLSAFMSASGVVAGLMCAIVLLKLSHDYLQGQGITLWQVLRPLFILVLVTNFNSFVASPLHSVVNVFTKSISKQVTVSYDALWSSVGTMIRKEFDSYGPFLSGKYDDGMSSISSNPDQQTSILGQSDNMDSWGRRTWNKVKSTVSKVCGVVRATGDVAFKRLIDMPFFLLLVPALETLGILIMQLLLLGQQITCYVFLTILTIVGPLAFALAILPAFSHNITSWLSRYIQIALWVPIGQIVVWINQWLMAHLADMCSDYALGGKYVILVAVIVASFLISKVKVIASYIVESAGTSGAESNGVGNTVVSSVTSLVTRKLF